MFIYTAKLNRKRAVLAVLILAAVLIAVILLAGSRDQSRAEAAALSAVVRTNEERVAYLEGLGWQVEAEPLEVQQIVIPKKFTNVYENYIASIWLPAADWTPRGIHIRSQIIRTAQTLWWLI